MSDTENPSLAHPANQWMHDPAQVAVVRQMKEDFDWAMARHRPGPSRCGILMSLTTASYGLSWSRRNASAPSVAVWTS